MGDQSFEFLHPEATRELSFSGITRFNPAFSDSLPFVTKKGNSFDLDGIKKWVKGADRRVGVGERGTGFWSRITAGRSLTIPIEFADTKGRKFGYIDIKGGGITTAGASRDNIANTSPFVQGVQHADPAGGSYLSNCEHAFDLGVKFDKHGVRVEVPIMVLKLDKQDPGLGEFLKLNPQRVSESFGVIVRAFRNPFRLEELTPPAHPNFNERERMTMRMVDMGMKNLMESGYLHKSEVISLRSDSEKLDLFFREVAFICGVNLGRIHELGYWVGNRTFHNVTIAAEEVDVGDGRFITNKFRRVVMAGSLMSNDVIEHARRFYLDDYLFGIIGNKDLEMKGRYISEFIKGYKLRGISTTRPILNSMMDILSGGIENLRSDHITPDKFIFKALVS